MSRIPPFHSHRPCGPARSARFLAGHFRKLHSSSISCQTGALYTRWRHSVAPIPIQRRIQIVDHRPGPAHAALHGQRRVIEPSRQMATRKQGRLQPAAVGDMNFGNLPQPVRAMTAQRNMKALVLLPMIDRSLHIFFLSQNRSCELRPSPQAGNREMSGGAPRQQAWEGAPRDLSGGGNPDGGRWGRAVPGDGR